MDILVAGANGGIGLAVVRELVKRFPQSNIYATYHRKKPSFKADKLTWYPVNFLNEEEVEHLAKQLPHLDWSLNCIGMLHSRACNDLVANTCSDQPILGLQPLHQRLTDGSKLMKEKAKLKPLKGPEKSLASIDVDFLLENIKVNTLPSMLLAKWLTPLLKQSKAPKFAALSARVGSITDNQLGGWYSYRSSKAALNMFLKSMSIEWSRTLKSGVVLAFHPGTTDTELSKPFQANVDKQKLFSAQKVAVAFIDLIENSTQKDNGHFVDYANKPIDW